MDSEYLSSLETNDIAHISWRITQIQNKSRITHKQIKSTQTQINGT